MKTFITAFLTLFLVANLFAQKVFTKGYITTMSDETILADLYIPASGKIYVKKDGEKKERYRRMSLKDYGFIINNKKSSMFAATAFPNRAYDGYYINSLGDTIPAYIIRWSTKSLILYIKKNMLKREFSTFGIRSFSIQKGEHYERYDKISFILKPGPFNATAFGMNSELEQEQFRKALVDGKILLYKTQDFVGTVGSSYMMNGQMITRGGNGMAISSYVFIIDGVTHIIDRTEYGQLFKYKNARTKEIALYKLKRLFMDYPELCSNIDEETFEITDIPKLVEEYNEYFANQSK